MSFDRIAWMNSAFAVAEQQQDVAVFKDRITRLALLADVNGFVQTDAYEKEVGQQPGALAGVLGDVIRLAVPT